MANAVTNPFDSYGACETDEERQRFVEWTRSRPQPEQVRVNTKLAMRKWVDGSNAVPNLTVRCSSPYRKKPCRREIGRVWNTAWGHYFRATIGSEALGRLAVLNNAMDLQEAGLPGPARIAAEVAAVGSHDYDGWCEMPVPGLFGGVLLCCPSRHGNVAVYAAYLAEKCDAPRRVLDVPTHSKCVGYPSR